jgi:hypothetical protein
VQTVSRILSFAIPDSCVQLCFVYMVDDSWKGFHARLPRRSSTSIKHGPLCCHKLDCLYNNLMEAMKVGWWSFWNNLCSKILKFPNFFLMGSNKKISSKYKFIELFSLFLNSESLKVWTSCAVIQRGREKEIKWRVNTTTKHHHHSCHHAKGANLVLCRFETMFAMQKCAIVGFLRN